MSETPQSNKPQAIDWPKIKIGGEEFTVKFTWLAISELRRQGIDFFDPPYPKARWSEDCPPVRLPYTIEEQNEVEEISIKMVAAAVSTVNRRIPWQWVMENATPIEVIRISEAVRIASEKVAPPEEAATPAAAPDQAAPESPATPR